MALKLPALVTVAALLPSFAAAQQQCAPREVVLDRLSEGFGESRQSIGLAQGNRVVEVFASLESGTWTITVTLPNGTTCLVAAGNAFELLAETPMPSGTAS